MKQLTTFITLVFISSLILSAADKRPATVLLICDDAHVDSWAEFAKWKTSIGKSTKIISTQQIAKNYKANDIQEKIRLCCIDHTFQRCIIEVCARIVFLFSTFEPSQKNRDFHMFFFMCYKVILSIVLLLGL